MHTRHFKQMASDKMCSDIQTAAGMFETYYYYLYQFIVSVCIWCTFIWCAWISTLFTFASYSLSSRHEYSFFIIHFFISASRVLLCQILQRLLNLCCLGKNSKQISASLLPHPVLSVNHSTPHFPLCCGISLKFEYKNTLFKLSYPGSAPEPTNDHHYQRFPLLHHAVTLPWPPTRIPT